LAAFWGEQQAAVRNRRGGLYLLRAGGSKGLTASDEAG